MPIHRHVLEEVKLDLGDCSTLVAVDVEIEYSVTGVNVSVSSIEPIAVTFGKCTLYCSTYHHDTDGDLLEALQQEIAMLWESCEEGDIRDTLLERARGWVA